MKDKSEQTPVIFRRWRDSGRVIALFPADPSDYAGDKCTSYMRVGQHSGADYHGVMNETIPVSMEAEDVKELLKELDRLGYSNLRVYRKASRRHHEARFQAGREHTRAK